MKANLYNEVEEQVLPFDEQKMAIAEEKPAPADVPKQGLYIVDYKTLVKPTLIALAIFAVWAVAAAIL